MRVLVVAAAFFVALATVPLGSTAYPQPRCVISEGTSIAGVQIGMATSAALAITGQPIGKRTSETETTYTLRAPWSHMVVESGIVRKVATRSAQCRTASGLGPGSALESVRGAYTETASSLVSGAEGDVFTYPFLGIAFTLKQNRVETVEIFAADRLTRSQPQPPQILPPRRPEPRAPVFGQPAPRSEEPADPRAYCKTARSIRELVAYQAGDRLVIYLIAEDDTGRMISTYGLLTVTVGGTRVRWDASIGCGDFEFIERGIHRELVLVYIMRDVRIDDIRIGLPGRRPSGEVEVRARLLQHLTSLTRSTTVYVRP